MKTQRYATLLFFILPAATLAVAFVGICVLTGTAWPWTRVVHEDGERTLLGTIFFFEHAARELVTDLVLALGAAGATRWFFPPETRGGWVSRARTTLLTIAAAVTTVIVAGTIQGGGTEALLDNLSQLHTRAGAPLVWGAHWRYHFIERFAEIMLAFSVLGGLWILDGRPDRTAIRGRRELFVIAWGLFVAFTLLFRVTSEPFVAPTFLGHQARELFTHVLVTLPLALGVCVGLSGRLARADGARSSAGLSTIVFAGLASVASALFLLVMSLLTGARDQGQTDSLAGLLFPHFFEHALGYLLVPALAGGFYLLPGPHRPAARGA